MLVFSITKPAEELFHGIEVTDSMKINVSRDKFFMIVNVTGGFVVCFRLVQASFAGITAVYVRGSKGTNTVECAFLKTHYQKDQFESTGIAYDIVGKFNISTTDRLNKANEACNDLSACASPSICVSGTCTNNKVGVIPHMAFIANKHPTSKGKEIYYMYNTTTRKQVTATSIISFRLDKQTEIGTLPVKK